MTEDPTLDLHGLRVAEALRHVDGFLRDERASGAMVVRIVTGQGTGAVKRAVRELLGRHAAVLRWEPAFRNDGVTVVVLRGRSR